MATPAEVPSTPVGRAESEWRACIAAFAFLTRLPVRGLARHDASDLPASAAYFPVVGLIVAGAGALVYVAAAAMWPAALAVVIAVAATVWITGAFHEDAVADAFDGFGGGWSREQILTIMKDSRVGSYALVAVVLLLLAKVGALAAVATAGGNHAGSAVARALVAGHVLGRWSSVPLIWRYDYVRAPDAAARASAGGPFARGVTSARALAATGVAFGIVLAICGGRGIAAVALAAIVTAVGGRYAVARLGGITGDVLGAVNQFVELAAYLVLAARPLSF